MPASTTPEIKPFLVRLTADEHAALRGYAHATGVPMGEVVREALRRHLTGEGRQEHVHAATVQAMNRYSAALEKLADM